MKYRTETRTKTVMYGPAGQEREVPEEYEVRIPVPPRDWDVVAVRVAAGLILALTMVTVVWSTVSIGALLRGGVGYAAAAIFDVAWLINVLLEWLSRYDEDKRKFPRRLGWGLLVATMGAIGWHGVLVGSIPLAVVGAAVSLFAKILWLGIMRHIDRDLSPRDRAWVKGETSKANALLAVAGVRRMVARAEARSALELLAAEQTRAGFSGLSEEPETVRAFPETVSSDAMASVRRDAISPAGQGADIRPEHDGDHVSGPDGGEDVRPEPVALRPVVAFRAEAERENEGEPEPVAEGRSLSLAGVVRGLYEAGVTDPKAIGTAARILTGREANPDSVARELRAAKAAQKSAAARAETETGPYL